MSLSYIIIIIKEYIIYRFIGLGRLCLLDIFVYLVLLRMLLDCHWIIELEKRWLFWLWSWLDEVCLLGRVLLVLIVRALLTHKKWRITTFNLLSLCTPLSWLTRWLLLSLLKFWRLWQLLFYDLAWFLNIRWSYCRAMISTSGISWFWYSHFTSILLLNTINHMF